VNPYVKSSLLWGVVGALSYLVLLQGYELVGGARIDLLVKFGVAIPVAVGAAVVAYAYQRRLAPKEQT